MSHTIKKTGSRAAFLPEGKRLALIRLHRSLRAMDNSSGRMEKFLRGETYVGIGRHGVEPRTAKKPPPPGRACSVPRERIS
jgi:hypothetical protein